MATAEQYAEWIVNNKDKKGTPEFDKVAAAYKIAKGLQQEPEPEVAKTNPDDRGGFMNTGTSGVDLALGVGDAALTMGSGMIGQTMGGLAGIATLPFGVDTAADVVGQVSEQLTWTPRSQTARTLLGMAAAPFEPLIEGAEKAGEATFEATGSPGAATAVQTGIEMSPMALGLKKPKHSMSERRADIKTAEQSAEKINLDLDASLPEQRAQIVGQATKEVGGEVTPRGEIVSRGESLPEVQTAVQKVATSRKEAVDDLYTQARQTEAGIPVEQTRIFRDHLDRVFKDIDVYTDPKSKVRLRIDELDRINKLPDGSHIKLNAMERWRKKIGKNWPADPEQQQALTLLKREYDTFRDQMFNADMVKGDKTAITKWKNAIDAASEYKRTFKDDKVISQLVEQNATPETMRKWIFGASEAGFQSEAGAVVKRLKDILGENSPQIRALRQDALLNILDPLLSRDPNFGAFVKNYLNVVRKNQTLIKELLPESEVPLRELYDYARAVAKRDPKDMTIDVPMLISRFGVGHEIAIGGAKVGLLRQFLGKLAEVSGQDARSKLISEFVGYNINSPLIPVKPAVIGGGVQVLQDESLEP